MDIWATIAAERRATADLLEPLTAEQWATPSLCGAWTVKDVAVHLVPTTGKGLGEFVGAVLRQRGEPPPGQRGARGEVRRHHLDRGAGRGHAP